MVVNVTTVKGMVGIGLLANLANQCIKLAKYVVVADTSPRKSLLNLLNRVLRNMENEVYHICVSHDKLSVVLVLWCCYVPQSDFVIRQAKREDSAIIVTRDALFAAAVINDITTAEVHIEKCKEKIIKI